MMLPELEGRFNAIKRYGLYHVIQQQTVAAHVFNVCRLSEWLVDHWFPISKERMDEVYYWALHHEDTEALSGDFMAMVKPYFDEERFEKDFADLLPHLKFPPDEEVRIIVKLADLMDCYNFFAMEIALGNAYMSRHLGVMAERIREFVKDKDMYDWVDVDKWLEEHKHPRSNTFHRAGWSEDKL